MRRTYEWRCTVAVQEVDGMISVDMMTVEAGPLPEVERKIDEMMASRLRSDPYLERWRLIGVELADDSTENLEKMFRV